MWGYDPFAVWLLVGLFLMSLELVIPGGIVVLLGLACLIVSGAQVLDLVHGLAPSMTLWFISSMILLLTCRSITQRLIGGDSHIGNTDERVDIFNQLAVVKEDIGPGQTAGRIRYLESDWNALGDGSVIKAGAKVKIICRENIGFIVEPVPEEINIDNLK
jgi:membrane protein implicated in regulation of membrane protease activity